MARKGGRLSGKKKCKYCGYLVVLNEQQRCGDCEEQKEEECDGEHEPTLTHTHTHLKTIDKIQITLLSQQVCLSQVKQVFEAGETGA